MTQSTTGLVELKPCAHCGSKDVGIEGIPGCRYVKCYGCGISTDDTSQERAIAAWNTRPTDPTIAELVAALENVRAIIAEGAAEGFRPLVGVWADRLFESQRTTSAALTKSRSAL